MDDAVNKLALITPKLRDEPQAYCKARIRQGYEAGRREALEQAAALIEFARYPLPVPDYSGESVYLASIAAKSAIDQAAAAIRAMKNTD